MCRSHSVRRPAVSLIRPGSFCGVYAMKPTWNAVSAEGVKLISTTLDTVGWYGRSVADLALLADTFALQDDETSSFQTVAGARILIDATAYKADAASLDALAQAAQPAWKRPAPSRCVAIWPRHSRRSTAFGKSSRARKAGPPFSIWRGYTHICCMRSS